MNTDNSNVRSGGMIRSDSPSSGSHASGSNELPAKLVSETAAMDYEMKTLKSKIKSKQEEEERLLETKTSIMSSLSGVRKQLVLLQDREQSFNSSLNRVKDSNTALEGMEVAVIQNLKAIQISNDEQKFKCNEVINKYSTTINSHQETFAALPWAKEKKLLSMRVENKRVMLGRLKMQQQESSAKLRLLERISENRQQIEILHLSMLIIERENSLRDGREKDARRRMVEQEIRSLEQEKALIQENIASRTQEMILRIMNRSNDRPQKLLEPIVARAKISTPQEIDKQTGAFSIKDRLGIGKRHQEINKQTGAFSIKDRLGIDKKLIPTQDSYSASLSIGDRLGINKKQLNVNLTTLESRQINKDGEKEANSQLSAEHDLFKHKIAGPSYPTPSKGDATEHLETGSNRETIPSEEVEQNNETDVEPAQTAHLPALDMPLNSIQQITDVPVIATVLHLSTPLKAILKPSSSQCKKSVIPQKNLMSVPPLIFPSRIEVSSTQNAAISTDETCANEKQLADINFQQPLGRGLELLRDGPASKKPRMTQKMPLARLVPPSQRQQTIKRQNQPPKTPKRVSFVSNSEENQENEPSRDKGINMQQGTLSNTTSQSAVVVDVEMESSESSPKLIEPDNESVEPVDVSAKTSDSQLPSVSHKEHQPSSTGDEFQHLFSPSLQPFSAPQQGTPGNFDSIFGAIFNSPDTSKKNAGFQFDPHEAVQKQTTNDSATPSSNTGQDFFSFFATPNTEEPKKSYNDNFFKLF